MLSRTSIGSHAEVYEYDGLNRLVKVTYDDKSTVSYTYDNNGNILSVVYQPYEEPVKVPELQSFVLCDENGKPVSGIKIALSDDPVDLNRYIREESFTWGDGPVGVRDKDYRIVFSASSERLELDSVTGILTPKKTGSAVVSVSGFSDSPENTELTKAFHLFRRA